MAECGGWTISQYGRVLEIGPSFQYGRMLKLLIWQDMEEGPSSQYGRVWRLDQPPNMAGCGGWTSLPIWQRADARPSFQYGRMWRLKVEGVEVEAVEVGGQVSAPARLEESPASMPVRMRG